MHEQYLEAHHFVNKTFYKIMNPDLYHSGLQYKLGLNILTAEMLESNCSNGFHFCDARDIPYWMNFYPNGILYEINIPSDAKVIKQAQKYKTDRLCITTPLCMEDFVEQHKLAQNIVIYNGLHLRYAINQTSDVCGIACKQNGLSGLQQD